MKKSKQKFAKVTKRPFSKITKLRYEKDDKAEKDSHWSRKRHGEQLLNDIFRHMSHTVYN